MSKPLADSVAAAVRAAGSLDQWIARVLKRYWGFESLRPLQREAVDAGLEGRDSLVVMPTGGGKSLCYQLPPLIANRVDVVVSPLISLMKDQVDGLVGCGYPAAALHSNLAADERDAVMRGLAAGNHRLLFVSPERLLQPQFLEAIQRVGVRAFAIDEAHCISHWGHDFRPEYRRMATLRQQLGQVSLHAFTATATPRVQQDIVDQLELRDPRLLVGRFDRPNLVFRIVPRTDLRAQLLEVIERHRREAVICYCITRRETEQLAGFLEQRGISAAPYHAGMDPDARRRTQEAFANETLDVVVATVAFGMGIDRSNVRCVVHAGMPRSIEHYQQETGRAGRDGLEAECVLLYSPADVMRWRRIIGRDDSGAVDADDGGEEGPAHELLRHMQGLCGTLECRHSALTRYFGQTYEQDSCNACDVCLGDVEAMAESTVVAQKVLSCVARVEQRYGIGHVVQVLRGVSSPAVERFGHDSVSTFGILRELPAKTLTNLIYQLVDQQLLERTAGDRPVLRLNRNSVTVLRGEREVQLLEPKAGPVKRAKSAVDGWEGVDEGLFEHLRALRAEIARERSIPAYVVFGDKTLRAMARERPTTPDELRGIYGVGEKKLADPGPRFLEAIRAFA